MTYNNYKYVILNTTEITDENSTIDFSKLLNRNAAMLRYSTDDSKAIIKYDGKTAYTHSQILGIVNNTEGEWYAE